MNCNRIFRFVMLMSYILLPALVLSCTAKDTAPGADTSDTSETAAPSDTTALIGGETDYIVVRGENADDVTVEAAKKLCSALSAITDRTVAIADDFDGKADNSGRLEILVGETNRAESVSALADCGELQFVIRLDGNKLVITGKSPAITSFAVDYFLKSYCGWRASDAYEKSAALGVDAALSVKIDYPDAANCRDYDYDEVTNMNCQRPDGDITYSTNGGGVEYGETGNVTVSRSDPKYGGPQFIAKLYTEALSRAPEGAEYSALAARIEENGCDAALLGDIASELFDSAEFAALKLTRTEECFAVYRAILSRDPTVSELDAYGDGQSAGTAAALTETAEFAALLPDIIAGPYYWYANNETVYTGDNVIKASELQKRLEEYTETLLPQGTLVIMDVPLTLPRGAVLATEGNPTHYLKMARLLRPKSAGVEQHLVYFGEGSTLSSIFIDGNMSAFSLSDTASGSNTVIAASYCSITHCRVSDSTSHQNIWSLEGTEQTYIAYNLITGYASDHDKTWQDGISCLSTASVIEYNDIVDVTDGAIAVFRYLENDETYLHTRAQDSIIRYNKIFNAGNSCYAAHDYETVNYGRYATGSPLYPANMTGLVSYENQIWTSWRAHYHLAVTFSTMPWQGDVCDRAFGSSFYNNSSPEGCFIVCACGICVDKVTDAAVRGNSFEFYVGDWCRDDSRLRSRAYSVNAKNSSGDFQPGAVDMAMSTESAVFIVNKIGGLALEDADTVTLRGYKVKENRVTIPASRFLSE